METVSNKKNIFEFVLGILLIVCAVLSFLKPVETFMALAYIIAAIAIIKGLHLLYLYTKLKDIYKVRANTSLVIAVILILLGLIFIIKPEFASNVFSYILAVWFIYDAVNNFLSFSILKTLDMRLYFFGLVCNLLMMAGGIMIIVNPWVPQITLSVVLGITFLLSGMQYIIFSLTGRKDDMNINLKNKNKRVN